MSSSLSRFCAVCLIVLSACPFTAPFLTIDPGLLHSEMATDQGPIVKPGAAQDEMSALPSFSALDLIVSDLPAARGAARADRSIHLPFRFIVLRL